MTDEERAMEIRNKHGLCSLHLFQSDIPGRAWRVFGNRVAPQGWQESAADGGGMTIREALDALDERLTAGPLWKQAVTQNSRSK